MINIAKTCRTAINKLHFVGCEYRLEGGSEFVVHSDIRFQILICDFRELRFDAGEVFIPKCFVYIFQNAGVRTIVFKSGFFDVLGKDASNEIRIFCVIGHWGNVCKSRRWILYILCFND